MSHTWTPLCSNDADATAALAKVVDGIGDYLAIAETDPMLFEDPAVESAARHQVARLHDYFERH